MSSRDLRRLLLSQIVASGGEPNRLRIMLNLKGKPSFAAIEGSRPTLLHDRAPPQET